MTFSYMTFATLIASLKADAKAIIQVFKDEGKKLETIELPIIESAVAGALAQFKTLAIATVAKMATEEFAVLSGEEKQGNVVTAVYQAAEAAGVALAIQDAQLLAQHAYTAFMEELGIAQASESAQS